MAELILYNYTEEPEWLSAAGGVSIAGCPSNQIIEWVIGND
jgi:hypothetical protein